MTAPFSLSSIDSASLEWPDLPGVDAKLDVLVPASSARPVAAPGWRQLGACMDELAATKALTELLDGRSKPLFDRAGTYMRATFTIECNPADRALGPISRDSLVPAHVGMGRQTRRGPLETLRYWSENLTPVATLALLVGAWFVVVWQR